MKWTFLLLYMGAFLKMKAQDDSLNQAFLKKLYHPVAISYFGEGKKRTAGETPFFAGFEVVDYRPDTTRVGFWAENKVRQELQFDNGLTATIASCLNKGYAATGGDRSFLIVIKKLWLYDTITNMRHHGSIALRLEAFLKKQDKLIPYTFLDTTVTGTVAAKDMVRFRFPGLFDALINKIRLVDEATVVKNRTKFTLSELAALNRQRYTYPMDTARQLQKGIYATVEEFRNNHPSVFNYVIEKGENGLLHLYLKDERGNTFFSRKMWGYCDGERCYMMMDGNLSPLFKVDHAFYAWGFRESKIKTTSVPVIVSGVYGAGSVNEETARNLHLYALDVFTGTAY